MQYRLACLGCALAATALAVRPAAGAPVAAAEPSAAAADDATSAASALRAPAFEVNVLWPFFPGGIVDLKLMIPVRNSDRMAGRGELIAGLHSDFATRVVRSDDTHGKVALLGVKLGYRQFVAYGIHGEASADIGWREERQNVRDGSTLNAFTARLWLLAGWQTDVTPRVYINARGGTGLNLFRVGDRYSDTEKFAAFGGDLNLGFRF